jgi:23S rRNA (guanosine2251-2'-O)-methyltransferase
MIPAPADPERNINTAAAETHRYKLTQQIITGFHAVEERVRVQLNVDQEKKPVQMRLLYSKPGPRIKEILSLAEKAGIPCSPSDGQELDNLVKVLPAAARDHRGIVLCIEGNATASGNIVDFDQQLASFRALPDKKQTVLVLDSVTDPHNAGAILRSCDQFGVSLVVMPERRGVRDVTENDVIARSSAGASSWVPVTIVKNLVRALQLLKDDGFWIYGADAGGTPVQELHFSQKTALIMGSEGNGIGRLVGEQCDTVVSIPTCGRIDSLNVSVAAGVLLYEIYRQTL